MIFSKVFNISNEAVICGTTAAKKMNSKFYHGLTVIKRILPFGWGQKCFILWVIKSMGDSMKRERRGSLTTVVYFFKKGTIGES